MGNIKEETARIKIIDQTTRGKEYLAGVLTGKKIVMIFQKPSFFYHAPVKPRLAFQLAAIFLGARTVFIENPSDWKSTVEAAAELADLIIISRRKKKNYQVKTKMIDVDAYTESDLFTVMATLKTKLNPDFLLPSFQI